MTWGEESQGDTERFEARSLPEASYRDLEHTDVAGIGAAAPNVDPTREGSGLVEVKPSTGSTAWKRRLAPHHRTAVQNFFSPERDTQR